MVPSSVDTLSQTLLHNKFTLHMTLNQTLLLNSTKPKKLFKPYSTRSLQASGISPKSEPSLTPSEAGNVPRHCVDAHTSQLVQPQGLNSRECGWKKMAKSKIILQS